MVQDLVGCAGGRGGLGVLQSIGAWGVLSSMGTWVGCCSWRNLGSQWVKDGQCGWAGDACVSVLMEPPGSISHLLSHTLACPGGASHPCSDHGVCMDGMSGSGQCRCHSGFAGTACELCATGAFGPHCQGGLSYPALPSDSLSSGANSIFLPVPFPSLPLYLSWLL